MDKPWEIKPEDTRQEDSIPNFIIICEDSVSEPIYFNYFQTPKIKINCIRNKKSMMASVLTAIHHCETNELASHKDGEFCIGEGSHVWCVFDRDKEENEEKLGHGNIEFNESIETAKRRGINIAWSNDSFELWILLHFEEVRLEDIDRKVYYDRLTEIFRDLDDPNEDLLKVLKHPSYSYKRDLKSKNNFKDIVRNEIVEKTETAIERAKLLEANFQNTDLQNHEKSPCTLVHLLVEKLIALGGKEI